LLEPFRGKKEKQDRRGGEADAPDQTFRLERERKENINHKTDAKWGVGRGNGEGGFEVQAKCRGRRKGGLLGIAKEKKGKEQAPVSGAIPSDDQSQGKEVMEG